MTAEEKFIDSVRDYLIEETNGAFLKLSEEGQNNLILATVQSYIEKMKTKNYIERNKNKK